jgi:hypothetical protein
MLDYAANGVEYWDLDRVRQSAAETAESKDKSLDEEVAQLLGEDAGPERVDEYWREVAVNLKDRRVRLIFVSDSTPKELRRLVEFLNEEMSNVEVLAVEVKRYSSEEKDSHQAIVPRVIGATEAARTKKTESPHRRPQTTTFYGVKDFDELKLAIRDKAQKVPTSYMDLLLLENKDKTLSTILREFRVYAEKVGHNAFKTVSYLRGHIKYREDRGWLFENSGDSKDPIVILVGLKAPE